MRTRGFTLIELMVVIVVISAILLFGFPRMQSLFTKSSLRGARSAVVTAVQQAKTYAVTDGRVTKVKLDASTGTMWLAATPRRVWVAGSTDDTIGAVRHFETYGAAVSPTTEFAFDQRGLLTPVSGSPQKVVVSKSGYRDSVMINGYGRIAR